MSGSGLSMFLTNPGGISKCAELHDLFTKTNHIQDADILMLFDEMAFDY